jgi:hypothetical protein
VPVRAGYAGGMNLTASHVAIQLLAILGGYQLASRIRFPTQYPNVSEIVWLLAFVLLILGVAWAWMNGQPDRRSADLWRCAVMLIYCLFVAARRPVWSGMRPETVWEFVVIVPLLLGIGTLVRRREWLSAFGTALVLLMSVATLTCIRRGH